jgi:acetyl esterase
MALDPQARAFLDQLAAMGAPPLTEATPEQARAAMSAMAAIGGEPEEKAATEDRAIPGPSGDIPVRIYRPGGEARLPAIVFFHGGGFVIGDIGTHDGMCHQLATRVPAVVVSVDYRLAPEHRFPAAVDDCFAATEWVSAHAGELGADARRLAVAGDSAGGNLSAVVALRARDSDEPSIAFQLLVYPATDMTRSAASHRENGEGYLLTTELIDWFMAHYFGPAGDLRHRDASPLFVEDLSGLPPALVITAEFDPLRDEGEAYADRLRQAGVNARASRYDGMIHGFFGMDAVFDASKKAIDEAVAALQDALVPTP